MRNLTTILTVLLFLSCAKKNETPTENPGPVKPVPDETGPLKTSGFISQMTPVFSDDFNGTTFDERKWAYRADNTVRGYATVSGAKTIAFDGNGNLVIKTIKDADGKYYVGQLCTDGKFTQKYGYFECRAKMQKAIGTHSSFWLQSNTMGSQADNALVAGAEIDIFEYLKPNPNATYHTVHWGGYGATHQSDSKIVTNATINDGNFHTFGLLWSNVQYIFFVDGTEVSRTSKGLSGVAEYMILSTELTGFGGDYTKGVYPDEIVFDYVKTYQFK
ncbi:glycoside hydrolase family 16 protein [Pedobacter sp. ISL-68]|uniref:glycoside hydrolase family 16 protein n=1 Tax=unclassified Pedobacter TaxID=2628915 RepID=UPI001BECDC79|nr:MULTISPECIES: glycoside hydrolase family 16 protein [unclassified Pedobacter]MBT2564296.1 glycoside hydrolase family 16 protein [Pedobacter sp. ISL-64]MBT2593116.1 glycoside hydrolase family 16 protein [Pedobacter sp. ISL-68]